MAEQIPPNPPTLHDRLFKEFLHRFLREFMEIFFPVEAARLDFTTVAFLQQELVINLPGQVLRITDVVAELNTLDGEPEAIILHVDVEANKPKPLPKRMFDYYALLRILLQRQVLPIALKNGCNYRWNCTWMSSFFVRKKLKGILKNCTQKIIILETGNSE